jgi:hypothetical protein
MKKSIIIATAIFAASFATNANAQTAIKTNAGLNISEPLSVKFLGSQDDYLVFRVEIKTGTANRSVFKIEDATEGELYSNTINTGTKYQLLKIEKRDFQVLDFKLVSENKVYTKTFTTEKNDKLYQKGLAVL